MPNSPPVVRAIILKEFARFLEGRGLSATEIFARAGLTLADITDPERNLRLDTVARLFEEASTAAGDPALGIQFARSFPVGGTGVLGFLFVHSRTVADAMRTVARFVPLLGEPRRMTFEESPRGGVLWWRWPDAIGYPFTQLGSFAAALLTLRLKMIVANPGWQPLEVEMQNAPLNKAEVHNVFGQNVNFLAGRNAIHVDAATLRQPIAHAEPGLRAVLESYGERMMAELPSPDVGTLEQTRAAIEKLMPERRVSLDEIATYLNCPPRTLQARLASQSSKTFEEILNDARKARAEELLKVSNVTMTEIALHLGFSELSAFTRAAQRWFGRTPSAQRQFLRARAGEP
ncbi:MAG: AraC family transcriptional regulator [Hyphomicrobium sp.]|nr:AraC family transcriptional regulator [Hyphomicrobium sp.]